MTGGDLVQASLDDAEHTMAHKGPATLQAEHLACEDEVTRRFRERDRMLRGHFARVLAKRPPSSWWRSSKAR